MLKIILTDKLENEKVLRLMNDKKGIGSYKQEKKKRMGHVIRHYDYTSSLIAAMGGYGGWNAGLDGMQQVVKEVGDGSY